MNESRIIDVIGGDDKDNHNLPVPIPSPSPTPCTSTSLTLQVKPLKAEATDGTACWIMPDPPFDTDAHGPVPRAGVGPYPGTITNVHVDVPQLITNEVRRNFNALRQSHGTNHYLIDVIFVFDGIKLGAHRVILLDEPINSFFHAKLRDKKGLSVIDVPVGIDPVAVDTLLNYIYGMTIDEIGITNQNLELILNAAAYLKMDVQLLPKLLNVSNNDSQKLEVESFVSTNFQNLSNNVEFWELSNETILLLCNQLSLEAVFDAFLDWIQIDKTNRRNFLFKLVDLGKYFPVNNTALICPLEDLKPEQIISDQSRLKFNTQRGSTTNERIDVIFKFEDGAELGAHKLILLDGPKYDFFHEKLRDKKGCVTIDVPVGITLSSIDPLISYIYGMPINELGVTEEALERFLNAAAYLKMDMKLIPKLLTIFNAQSFQVYISANFNRLSGMDDFWIMDNTVIMELCIRLTAETIENAFLDWIHDDKAHRKYYLTKLLELHQLIASGGNNLGSGTETESLKFIPNNNADIEGIDFSTKFEEASSQDDTSNTETESHQTSIPISKVSPRKRILSSTTSSAEDEKYSTTTVTNSPNSKRQRTSPVSLETCIVDGDRNKQSTSSTSTQGQDQCQSRPLKSPEKIVRRSSGSSSSSSSSTSSSSSSSSSSGDTSSTASGGTATLERKSTHIHGTYPRATSPKKNRTTKQPGGTGKQSGNHSTTIRKLNSIDYFFIDALNKVRKHLDEGTWDSDFLSTWKTLWQRTLPILALNQKIFLEHGGIKALLDSRARETLLNDPNPELSEILLSIIDNLAAVKAYRSFVFTDEILDIVLRDLQKLDFKSSTTAGQILCYFLHTYGLNKWTVNASRIFIAKKVQDTILRFWSVGWDDNVYFPQPEEYKTFNDLIHSYDRTAKLCGLFMLNYCTSNSTKVFQRNVAANHYCRWLDGHRENIDRTFLRQLSHTSGELADPISYYAGELLRPRSSS